jgi:Holliday junction resolvase RusA-like endonuclease
MSAESRAAKEIAQTYMKLAMKGRHRFKEPLFVEMLFTVKKAKMPAYICREYPAKRPDLDNYIKAIKDFGNELLWDDDALIVRLLAEKKYGEKPGIFIRIHPLLAAGY